jgi:hypothetical protein
MSRLREWARVAVTGPADSVVVLGGPGPPDLGAVDLLARVLVAVRRAGHPVAVTLSTELAQLVELAGLTAVVAGSAVEVGGQAEGREEGGGVQEEGHPGDAPA